MANDTTIVDIRPPNLACRWVQRAQHRLVLLWPPPTLFYEIAGFETNSRPYLLKYGVPCDPDGIVR